MSATVSAEEEAAVRRFLAEANVAEVVWGWTLETTFAEAYFSEALVDVLEAGAADYRANDLRRASLLDEERSYFVAVWAADGGGYEAGVCEWWEVQGYRLSDGAAVGLLDRTPRLVAQTVRVQEVDGRWLVTDVVGHEGVGFCD